MQYIVFCFGLYEDIKIIGKIFDSRVINVKFSFVTDGGAQKRFITLSNCNVFSFEEQCEKC